MEPTVLSPESIKALTPKRLAGDGGLDGWYPYYAGFSSRFARSALATLNLPNNALVLDPWVGSGTSVHSAQELGCRGVGVDLNPFAVLVTKAKLASQADTTEIEEVAHSLASAWTSVRTTRAYSSDPLSEWLPPRVGSCLRYAMSLLGCPRNSPRSATAISPASAFLVAALAAVGRELAGKRPSSNPTWVRPGAQRGVRAATLTTRFLQKVSAGTPLLSSTPRKRLSSVSIGDSRHLRFGADTVDAVLTSPPYCTRIDYAVKTGFELALLGTEREAVDTLRRDLMGTTALRTRRGAVIPETWATEVRTLLAGVRSHPTHRSSQYYFPNLLQYFADAHASLGEINRVLKPGARALLVLQTSYYKEIEISLPELFVAMGRIAGLHGEVVVEVPLGRVMTTINTSSNRYRKRTRYREAVVLLQKPKC